MNLMMVVKAGILALALSVATPCIGAARELPTQKLPEEITIGPAEDNAETSAAIEIILQHCAHAYETAPAMHAAGTFVYAAKEDEQTTYFSAKLKLDFIRPDKIAVISESNVPSYQFAFYADGTTITQVSNYAEQYIVLPQTDLAGYAVSYRAGDIYTDYSDALDFAGLPTLLLAPDALESLKENVIRYVYEGEEKVGKTNCYRIRFIQENPDSTVIIWIDKKTWLIPKMSYIHSYDENYNMVDSFEAGDEATMTVINWDVLSTSKDKILPSAFKAKVPKDFELRKANDRKSTATQSSGKGSFWDRLVGTAAETSNQETTWSLTRRTGDVNLTLEEFVSMEKQPGDADATVDEHGNPTGLTVLSEDNNIRFYNYDGTIKHTLSMPDRYGVLAYLNTTTSAPLMLVAAETSDTVKAYDINGKLQWSYSHPFAIVKSIRSTDEPFAYIDLGGAGTRKLDEHGKVLFANANISGFSNANIAPAGTDRIVKSDLQLNISILNKDLKNLSETKVNDFINNVLWDTNDIANPLVCHTITRDKDIIWERRDADGDVVSTTMLEPKSASALHSLATWVTLKINGKLQQVTLVFLADGQLFLVDKSGKIIYRGEVKANTALIEQNGGNVMKWIVKTDSNNDGADEIYFPLNTHLMRLVAE